MPAKIPPLCEVLDRKNRPICLVSHKTALAQGLRHRAFAVILRGRDGRYILRGNGENFGFYEFSFTPYGMAAEDAALAALAPRLGECLPRAVGRILPCPESRQAIVDLFVADVARHIAPELESNEGEWLFLTRDELAAFGGDAMLEPFLRHALSLGFFTNLVEQDNF